MISHKYKFIFIHIPKCAGTSVSTFLNEGKKLSWKEPNYELIHGYCPKRRIFMQHATADQLLEMESIPENIWESYFKFTFVRNPYDRAISDYNWLKKDQNIKGNFKDYLNSKGVFKKYLEDKGELYYRGEHKYTQTSFFDIEGKLQMNYIGRFETIDSCMVNILNKLGGDKRLIGHENKSDKNLSHYSHYYSNSAKTLIDDIYFEDLKKLNYNFEDRRKGIRQLLKLL